MFNGIWLLEVTAAASHCKLVEHTNSRPTEAIKYEQTSHHWVVDFSTHQVGATFVNICRDICTSTKKVMFMIMCVCLFVALLAELCKNYLIVFNKIQQENGTWAVQHRASQFDTCYNYPVIQKQSQEFFFFFLHLMNYHQHVKSGGKTKTAQVCFT